MWDECVDIQQNLYENLGNREYDCFQESEEKYLKLKIGYTLFGPPTDENVLNNLNNDYTAEQCYDKKQNKMINDYLKIIQKYSVYYEDPTLIYASFMFNCLLNNRGINYYPIFRVRKCFGSPTGNDCCEFIDEHLRVYNSWSDYLENNKLPVGIMFAPKDGKYKGDSFNKVLLNIVRSPASSPKEDLKKVGDLAATTASFISGGIAIASLIPAITVAPFLLTGALITGAGVGVYSVARSSVELKDRKDHKQSISIKNEQARNCYLNIAAGATSVVTTGTTKAASLALNRGIIISETAAAALLSVNAVNMAVNGCNVANSLYKVISDVKNNKKPTAIDIMHLTTTVLFFGNAVVNLKSACVIYKESQAKPFSELVKNRSQDLWKRAKEIFYKADVTTHENNSSLKQVDNSDDYCHTILLPSFQERAAEFCQKQTLNILKDLIFNIDLDEAISHAKYLIKNKDNAYAMCVIILSRFENQVQQVLLKLVKYIFKDVIQEALEPLNKIFPQTEKIVIFFNYVINFLKLKVSQLEIEYQTKKADTLRSLQISEDEYERTCETFKNSGERMVYFLKITALKMICVNDKPDETLYKEMVRFFWDWLAQKAAECVVSPPKRNSYRNSGYRFKVRCSKCGGYNYTQK